MQKVYFSIVDTLQGYLAPKRVSKDWVVQFLNDNSDLEWSGSVDELPTVVDEFKKYGIKLSYKFTKEK